MGRVVVEGIGVVTDVIAVGIGRFGRIVGEGIAVVAHTVTVAVGCFTWVVGEGVLAVEHPVVVRVDVDDGNLVAHHGLTGIGAVGGCHFSLPGLSGRGQGGSDGGFSIVSGVDSTVHVPLNRGARFGVAVVVVVLVGEGQRLIGPCFRRRRDAHT